MVCLIRLHSGPKYQHPTTIFDINTMMLCYKFSRLQNKNFNHRWSPVSICGVLSLFLMVLLKTYKNTNL